MTSTNSKGALLLDRTSISWIVASTLTASQAMIICEDVLGDPIQISHYSSENSQPLVYVEYANSFLSLTFYTRPADYEQLSVHMDFSYPASDPLALEVLEQIISETEQMIDSVSVYG